MSDSIIQKQHDDKEEKDKTISELRNKIEEMEQKLKERDELLQRGEKRPRETTQVVPDINITVATSSSRFQRKLCQIDVHGPRPERSKSYPHIIDDDRVIGIEEDVQQLVQQLINTQSRTFMAIVGMGGSGKTTLAKKIYNHEKIIQYFDCRAWICVSQVWNVESIVKDIFSQITDQDSNNLTVTEMIQKINKLLGDKSYIIVLDDVWEADVLTKIMMPTAKSHRSKYVITTRNHKVTLFSDLKFSVHKPRRLTDDQSLKLFKKIAFDDQNNDHFVNLAEVMLRKCDGLPLAIISLAGLLRRKKTIQEWIKVKDNVSYKIIEDHVGPFDYGKVEDILGLSYSDLNHTLKSCFMYLSLFPEDANISCGVITKCWIAEGFFKSIWLKPKETVEDVAREYLNELIQRCLVQIVRVDCAEIVKTITVHDLLRDLALKRAKEKYFFDTLPSNSSPTSPMQFLRLSINLDDYSDGEELLEDLGILLDLNLSPTQNHSKVSRRLRSFILFNPAYLFEIHMKYLFTNYPLLRVLILYDLDDDIPDGIGSLIHLRYLRLSFDTGYIHLPDSLQNLRNLLSFDIRNGAEDESEDEIEIVKVPNVKQMKQLRYLRVPWASRDWGERSLNLHHLRNLKVLWGIPSGKWVMTELKHLSTSIEKLGINLIDKSEELEEVYQCPSILQDNLYSLRLGIWDNRNGEFKLQKLQHCNKLQKLYLDGKIAATGVPYVFPPYLVKLELIWTRIDDQDSFADALKRLTYLKVLKLVYYAYDSVDLTFPANSLLYLERLQLDGLLELTRIHVMEGAMLHLKSFSVLRCGNLKVIHVKEGAMPHVKSFYAQKNFYHKVLWEIPSGKWMMEWLKYWFPYIVKLGIIDIKNSEELDLLYQFPRIVYNLCALKLKLRTYDTEFQLQKLQYCTNLKELYLDGLIAAKNVPFVFPPRLSRLELERSGLDDQHSFADALQTLNFLKFLKLAHSAYVSAHLTFPSNSLLNLEKLQLYELEELERIHVMEGAMPHLKYLYVDNCHKLKEIPQCLRHLVRSIEDINERSDGDESCEFEDEDDDFF